MKQIKGTKCQPAFFIFLMVQFIRGISRDLHEAAEIDGASRFAIFIFSQRYLVNGISTTDPKG
jgi:ABC-type glycerol-3-phosphate transport system permease component